MAALFFICWPLFIQEIARTLVKFQSWLVICSVTPSYYCNLMFSISTRVVECYGTDFMHVLFISLEYFQLSKSSDSLKVLYVSRAQGGTYMDGHLLGWIHQVLFHADCSDSEWQEAFHISVPSCQSGPVTLALRTCTTTCPMNSVGIVITLLWMSCILITDL